jgi:hypothetical protein
MSDTDNELTAADLLRTAAAEGLAVTIDQLHRWCREGVMPRPRQRSLGRGRGTVAVYPPSAEQQLLALRRLLILDRNLRRVGLALWWQGYPVEHALMRQALEHALEQWEQVVTELTAPPGQLSDKAWTLIEGADQLRFGSKWLRQVRRRIGAKNFSIILHLLLRIITGQPLDLHSESDDHLIVRWAPAEWQLIERGLGLARARTDALPPATGWLTGPIVESLHTVAERLRMPAMRVALLAASDRDLEAARSEILTTLQVIAAAKTIAEAVLGRGALGLGAVPIMDLRNPDPRAALLLLPWLSLRQVPAVQAGYPTIATLGPWLQALSGAAAAPEIRSRPAGSRQKRPEVSASP